MYRNPHFDPQKKHHTPKGFKNTEPWHFNKNALDFFKWRWEAIFKEIDRPGIDVLPYHPLDEESIASNPQEPLITWLGHATVLYQIQGKNILTDPHFSDRASPVQWFGPRRFMRPAMSLEALPRIDYVVISHDHYDHLDLNSIRDLYARFGDEITFIVPLGIRAWLSEMEIFNVQELDWEQEWTDQGFRFYCHPVRHWSRRSLIDKNRRLWAGWGIETQDFKFFFTGDSAYTEQFKNIGQMHGPFDLAAIPIGAYEPRWFMKGAHMNPDEASQVHLDLQAKKSIAIHWGTFMLTEEHYLQPPKDLAKALM
ncbi:MAG: MBL fold metallo-hydrolase, partial [Bdellovibrionales bacterium]|nr:MBL fold metallo-hydrolase [Bdellovibrionales bacterium]